jgi:hypothetical protein
MKTEACADARERKEGGGGGEAGGGRGEDAVGRASEAGVGSHGGEWGHSAAAANGSGERGTALRRRELSLRELDGCGGGHGKSLAAAAAGGWVEP